MENLLSSLKRENKERERRLNVGDRKLLSDMVGYMKTVSYTHLTLPTIA